MTDAAIVANHCTDGNKNHKFERRNAQTSRAGWRPRKTSQAKLARDIAESIRRHVGRDITHYTLDEELTAMVKQELGW